MTSLAPIGRASREAIDERPGYERWHLSADDERVAKRLLALGADGVGGFVEGDANALVRAPGEPTLAAWLREHDGPLDWHATLAFVSSSVDMTDGETMAADTF